NLETITERIRQEFDTRTQARDQALAQARILTRHAANAIRAIHRDEEPEARTHLEAAASLAAGLRADLAGFPDLFFAGYTQDALKEFAEASIVRALVDNLSLPSPEDLGLEYATYLNGLAEAVGELRRRCLDLLRQGYSEETERLLTCMDDIYGVLVTLDYPDAITNGLRRQTDLIRGIVERTRGDLTISLREQYLQRALASLADRLDRAEGSHADHPGV
ncbi:MAG TPA: haloacid dehalogenase, partial [Candidatus Methylomirabilis sp.]|nr:haloacid dehalogenase [Candidatus Methylomirabilis sp.]